MANLKAAPTGDGGFALVTALWAALILALLASFVAVASRTEIRTGRTIVAHAKQRAIAQGIVNLVELQLLGPAAATLPLDGTPFAITYAGVKGRVILQDQGGLVDLNGSSADTLTRLLTMVGGLDLPAAQAMTDCILDWRERGAGRRLNGAKAADYAAAGYLYGPRERPFESVAELQLVMRMKLPLFKRIAPALTVYAQKATIDPEVAPAIVLVILPGMDAETIAETLAERARRHAEHTSQPGLIGGAESHAIAISVEIEDAGREHTVLHTAVRITGDSNHPIWTYLAAE